jgi:hypothetical protein
MSYLFPFFLIFAVSGLYLWLLGEASGFSSRTWSENALRAPWIGWAILLGALQVAHVFLPIIRQTAAALLLLSGLVAMIVVSIRIIGRRGLAPAPSRRELIILLAALGVASLLAFFPVFNACTKDMILYDLGLYYLKIVRWIETYPIMPGLANVQGHLGFNQPGFLFTALFDALLPECWGIFMVGGILPWLGLTLALFSMFSLGLHALGELEAPRPLTVAYACSLPVWIYAFLNENLSSGSPNLVVACVMIHLFLVFACLLFSRDEPAGSVAEILVVGAACLCLKLTSLGFVLGIWMVTAAVVFRREIWRGLPGRRLLPALALSAALLCVWLYRGVLLSGYPFFPSSLLGAPVDWRVPESVRRVFEDYILLWSRFPHGDAASALQGIAWIPHWFARMVPNHYQFAWPVQVGIALAVALALFQRNRFEILRAVGRNILLIVPLLSFAVLWFVTAPDPRYFGPLAWLFAIAPALLWISRRFTDAFIACGATLCLSAVPIACFAWENRWIWITRERTLPQIPIVALEVSTNRHGVAVWYAKEGNRAFDAPLPSSWGFAPHLCLLQEAKGLAGGFKHVESSALSETSRTQPESASDVQNGSPPDRLQ